ncbi:hypothetical protein DFQ27_002559 [Actinomortierella ambigua]|uniref:Uncharacterized protein n=1 Tax=Actinomortierella ambigua TaxID=1343610 RepID=A0A9P6Q975_9FUNG|nr:hypothetical protein DFQ27_002559 [Actinomortierella ambigua]
MKWSRLTIAVALATVLVAAKKHDQDPEKHDGALCTDPNIGSSSPSSSSSSAASLPLSICTNNLEPADDPRPLGGAGGIDEIAVAKTAASPQDHVRVNTLAASKSSSSSLSSLPSFWLLSSTSLVLSTFVLVTALS